MSDSSMRLFNTALSATEVKELYSGASVPFKYKGANQTEMITATNDRTFAGASNWTDQDLASGGGSYDESGDLSITSGASGDYCYLANANIGFVAGKSYRVTVTASSLSGTSFNLIVGGTAQSIGVILNGTNSYEFTMGAGFNTLKTLLVQSSGTGGITLDDFSVVPIGAVAEYDGSGITNTKWYDKSGNELHGTVSGATDENTAGAPVVSENHPAFLARPASGQNNLATGSHQAVVFGAEVFNQGSNFASNTFTAPVTGKYQLNACIYLSDLDSAAGYYEAKIVTSNRNYFSIVDPDFGQDAVYWALTISVLADMDASDTASISIIQDSGTAQTDIGTDSFFSGYLVC